MRDPFFSDHHGGTIFPEGTRNRDLPLRSQVGPQALGVYTSCPSFENFDTVPRVPIDDQLADLSKFGHVIYEMLGLLLFDGLEAIRVIQAC